MELIIYNVGKLFVNLCIYGGRKCKKASYRKQIASRVHGNTVSVFELAV